MPCIEEQRGVVAAGGSGRAPRSAGLAAVAALTALAALLAGCATPAPSPAPSPATAPAAAPVARPAPAAPAVRPAPPPVAEAPGPRSFDLGPRVVQAPAVAARTMDEFKKQAARRMVAAAPRHSYMGTPPPLMFGITILEVEVNADGSVRNISVTRQPANPDAAGVVEVAKEAIRRGAPYGDMARLQRPWRWTEVFLFNDKYQFKPRTLD